MSGWINVNVKMPDDDETVMIAVDGETWMGFRDGDYGWRDITSGRCTVTHWMPLPEPPKGD